MSHAKREHPSHLRVPRLLLALLAAAVALPGFAAAAASTGQLDKLFEPWARTDSPGCAVAVTRDGHIFLERGYGMADLEQGIAIRPDTVFNMASVSKQFTAAAIVLLIQDGRLTLDDDVRRFVPELRDYGRPIRIRHLGSHTSGLRDHADLLALGGWNWVDDVPNQKVLDLIAHQEHLNFQPGEAFSYSNSGFFLLALIVERITGQTLGEFAAARIFGPLGMLHSRFYDDRRMIMKNRAVGHVPTENGGTGVWRPTYEVVGDGGLLTTVEDMALWEKNFIEPQLGKDPKRLVETLVTPAQLNDGSSIDYGFGLFLRRYRGLPTVEHGGNIPGYATYMLRIPSERFSVQVQCNKGGLPADRLVHATADLYLDDRFPEPPPAAVPPEPESETARSFSIPREDLVRFSGHYFSKELDAEYAIGVDGDGLSAKVGYLPALHFDPISATAFRSANGLELQFSARQGATPAGFILDAREIRGLAFVRR